MSDTLFCINLIVLNYHIQGVQDIIGQLHINWKLFCKNFTIKKLVSLLSIRLWFFD